MAIKPRGGLSKETELELIKQQLVTITHQLNTLQQQLETKYAQAIELAAVRLTIADLSRSVVTKEQFTLVRNIVYGGCGIILTTVLGAIVALVVTR